MKLNDLYPATLTILLIAILVGVGLTVLVNMSDAVRTVRTDGNDTFAPLTNANVDLFDDHISSDTASFINYTNGAAISTNCFIWDDTDDYQGDRVLLNGSVSTGCLAVNNSDVNVSYTYKEATTASEKLDSSVTAVGGFVNWFAVIVVIIAAAVIIGIVIRSFSGR